MTSSNASNAATQPDTKLTTAGGTFATLGDRIGQTLRALKDDEPITSYPSNLLPLSLNNQRTSTQSHEHTPSLHQIIDGLDNQDNPENPALSNRTVTVDMFERLISRNISATFSNSNHHFNLVMNIIGKIGVGHIFAISND